MAFIYDIIIVAIAAACVLTCRKHGLVRSVIETTGGMVSAFAASGMYILAACLQEPVAALAAAVLCGLCVGALSPGAMSVATDFLPQTGGWLLASLALSQDVGAALLPAVSGALTQKYEMRIAFLVLSVVPLLAAACLITMARLRGRQKKREEKERIQNLTKIP